MDNVLSYVESFYSVEGNTVVDNSFICKLGVFSPSEREALLRGEEIYDSFHNDGSYCGLMPLEEGDYEI